VQNCTEHRGRRGVEFVCDGFLDRTICGRQQFGCALIDCSDEQMMGKAHDALHRNPGPVRWWMARADPGYARLRGARKRPGFGQVSRIQFAEATTSCKWRYPTAAERPDANRHGSRVDVPQWRRFFESHRSGNSGERITGSIISGDDTRSPDVVGPWARLCPRPRPLLWLRGQAS